VSKSDRATNSYLLLTIPQILNLSQSFSRCYGEFIQWCWLSQSAKIMCPTGFRYPDWNREMDMYHQCGRCSTFYPFVSVYGDQWKIRAWMATIGRRPIGRFIVGGRRIFILPNAVRSVRMILSSRMSEKANERTDELARFSVGLWNPKGGSNLSGNSLQTARHSLDTIRVHALECEMSRRTTGN